MPKWGLTPEQRAAEPWGIDRDLLEPGKTITDPVHGDVYLTVLETQIVDAEPFQRLRRIKQLGNTHLVYPGATHTRFSHVLGALRVVQDLMDIVLDQRSSAGAQLDLFGEWYDELATSDDNGAGKHLEPDELVEFNRRVAKAVVLARLGALLHDFCHIPYGHSVEDELRLLAPHDKGRARFDRLWKRVPITTRRVIQGDLLENLLPMILPALEREEPAEYPFVEDMVGNTICADLLDYLRRDHLFTGLPMALGRRFEASFYVLPSDDPDFAKHLVLRVHREGHERKDTITEILKHLRYRYELSERALVHHAKIAGDAMVGKALEMWFDTRFAEQGMPLVQDELGDAAERFPIDDIAKALNARSPNAGKRVMKTAHREVEDELLRRGDDGLLEYLRALDSDPTAGEPRDRRRRRVVALLAEDLLSRSLYKRIGRQSHTRKSRRDFFDLWAPADARRRAEQRAAAFAEVEPAWHVLLWIPPADMRLKVANVLVDDGVEIQRFVDRERESGRRRGVDIYDAHEQLWEVTVFAHPSLAQRAQACRLILASLSADLAISLLPDDDELRDHKPHEWPDRIAIARLARQQRMRIKPERVTELIRARRQAAARGAGQANAERPALSALVSQYEALL